MTEILESVDWDEDKQEKLVKFVQHEVNNNNSNLLDDVESKFGLPARNVISNIIKSQLYFMNLSNTGDTNGN